MVGQPLMGARLFRADLARTDASNFVHVNGDVFTAAIVKVKAMHTVVPDISNDKGHGKVFVVLIDYLHHVMLLYRRV